MSGINCNSCSGVNQNQMMQHMQQMRDKAKTAGLDSNEAISKQDFVQAMGENGQDDAKMEKMFSQMDSNGDGEVSQQEREAMREMMQQRMGSFNGNGGGNQKDFNSVSSLLETLKNDTDDDEQKQKLQDILDKMQSKGGRNESTMNDSLSLINEMLPTVNISA
ncbi:MAG: hypothetical protein QM479_15300 [Pseudomonadota bacterium]